MIKYSNSGSELITPKSKEISYVHYLTLGMFDWRRYICDKCGWEGLRWAKDYRFKG